MHRHLLIIPALSCLALFAGCRPKVVPVPPPPRVEPATPEQVSNIRAFYRQHYPNCEVGTITEVLRENRLVGVADVDVSKLEADQVVTFIDAQQNVLATGRVIRVLPHSMHALYDAPTGSREPTIGDIMIRF